MKKNLKVTIISGVSGSGKSQAIKVLEDLGYFCIDNFLPFLLPSLVEGILKEGEIKKIAVVFDIRGGIFINDFNDSKKWLIENKIDFEVLFLDCKEEEIISRFKSTRRRHPLLSKYSGNLSKAINEERKVLEKIKESASLRFDTSNLRGKALELLIENAVKNEEDNKFLVSVCSFGFKFGIPLDADMVFDMRFIENPYYHDSMKFLTGEEQKVSDFVLGKSETINFLETVTKLIEDIIPKFIERGKKQLSISIGCTGGQHRSVAVSRKLSELLSAKGRTVFLYHREMYRYKGDSQCPSIKN